MPDFTDSTEAPNWSWEEANTGGGLADSATQVVTSIVNGDWLTGGANVAVASLDLLGLVDNPIKALSTSAIGWVIEHVSFLDWFLDHTIGDPGAVQNAAEAFMAAATQVDGIAGSQIRAFGSEVSYYRSGRTPSSVAFEERVGQRGDELKTLSLQCLGLGNSLSLAGALVASCRGLLRDMLAEFVWWLIPHFTRATALAPWTSGTSLVVALSEALLKGGQLARKMGEKLVSVIEQLQRLTGLLKKLAAVFDSPVSRAVAVGALKNSVPAITKYAEDTVTLDNADQAQQEVDARQDRPEPQSGPTLYPPPGQAPPVESKPQQGPGLPQSATWSTSGTLDE